MKHVVLLLTASIAIVCSFASAQKANSKYFNIYYAITDNHGGFTWQTYKPFNYQCVWGPAYCTIATSFWFTPGDNTVPQEQNMIYHTSSHSVYIPVDILNRYDTSKTPKRRVR